jgi:hypothetical protein
MPGQPRKLFRVRVRTIDGKPRTERELNLLRTNVLGGSYFYIHCVQAGHNEFIICTDAKDQIEKVREKLAAAGFEEIKGDTTVPAGNAPAANLRGPQRARNQGRAGNAFGGPQRQPEAPRHPAPPLNNNPTPQPKPYGFVGIPQEISTASPIWHDGGSKPNLLSGEIRLELTTLTPLLVGWERVSAEDNQSDWPLPQNFLQMGLPPKKSILCPLRAPWEKRPVVIPGDTLKGFLRHELGGLLGAPMERVAERQYSYRPNAEFPNKANPRLVARIARIPKDGVRMVEMEAGTEIRVPVKLELLPTTLSYDRRRNRPNNFYRFDDGNLGERYLGGQGAGKRLNSTRELHRRLRASPDVPVESVTVPDPVQRGFLTTVKHFVDEKIGHFSERHPQAKEFGKDAITRILAAAQNDVFQENDYIWVEWDTQNKHIVSLGWHYYYRWAYTDSVRKTGGRLKRHGLFPLEPELETDETGAPRGLSAVRRLFGFTGDNEGSQDIGQDDHSQLMGRVFVNSGLEVVGENETDENRFLEPTFLKELGMPRPSAVEHYIKQPYHPTKNRPTDNATLVTYGDAEGYDQAGELAGRKYYLDRADAYTGTPWKDDSNENKRNERSTLALEASKPKRKFRFTIRFRDLENRELAAILVALCPDQFKQQLRGNHVNGYCSKLGYARPLGWGSVQLEAKALLFIHESATHPELSSQNNILDWVTKNYQPTSTQNEWLAVHRHKNPDAGDYPKMSRNGVENIFTYHSNLRAKHSSMRRYKPGG